MDECRLSVECSIIIYVKAIFSVFKVIYEEAHKLQQGKVPEFWTVSKTCSKTQELKFMLKLIEKPLCTVW